MFYDRGPDGLPRKWIARMKAAMRKLAPAYNTNRMVRDYCEKFYVPAKARWEELTGGDMAAARELAEWKNWLWERFAQVRVQGVQDNMDGASHVGKSVRVDATVTLGEVPPSHLQVQLYHGRLDADGQLQHGQATEMTPQGEPDDQGRLHYTADILCGHSGLAGYTVRILPRHEALPDAREMGLIRWA